MIPDSESLSREYVQRLTDNYDAAAEARAERERWHGLYRLSELIARINRETGSHMNAGLPERSYYESDVS